MSKEGVPLQQDMFSGEWKDRRSRGQKRRDTQYEQPQQNEMFSQSELAQYVNPHPKMPFHPYERLELVSEDPRTPEEIERDTQREIEAQTYHLFDEHPEFYEQAADTEPVTGDENELGDTSIADDVYERKPEGSKVEIYFDLVRLSEENAETLWIAPPYETAYMTQIAATMLEAQAVGLTQPEITAALQIGQHRGSTRKTLYQASQP